MRRGRPSLLGTAARTAVIAGTATRVSGSVAHRQEQRHAAAAQRAAAAEQALVDRAAAQAAAQVQPPPAPPAGPALAPPPPGPAGGSAVERIAQLKELAELKAAGVLTDEEFAAEKARVLGT